RVIEVWNKIDLLPPAERPRPQPAAGPDALLAAPVSALTGEGLGALLEALETRIGGGRRIYSIALAGAALANLHRLYALADVIDRTDADDGTTTARVRVAPERDAEFRRLFPDAEVAAGGAKSRVA